MIIVILIIILFITLLYYFNVKNNNITNSKYVDDVSGLNETPIDDLIYVYNIGDIQSTIKRAKKNNKKISIRGQKHSMGGHTIAEDGYVIDMKYMNNIISLNKNMMLVTVEAGLTWDTLIKYVNQYGLSPMTLQSYSSFSIGGSISVNAHGITNDYGVYNSVVAIKMINSDGQLIECNLDKEAELFSLIIGGYGLFGIIYEITLKLVPNTNLILKTIRLNANNFCKIYNAIQNDNDVNIKIARIDITNMIDINLYIMIDRTTKKYIISELKNEPNGMSKFMQIMYKWILPLRIVQKLRYGIENILEAPLDLPHLTSRNELLYETAEPLANLYNPFIDLKQTHILQEYFIPPENFDVWLQYLHKIFTYDKLLHVILLNITIRYVKRDNISYLKYAPKDMYAFVFYYRIEKNVLAESELKMIHNKLTNYAIKLSGTFYLPYLQHYTMDQLEKAYPNIGNFVTLKKKYDSSELFSNKFYEYLQ